MKARAAKSIPSAVLWAVWLATRTALYLHATAPGRIGDAGLYQRWSARCFSHGTFLLADPIWQYPPGAALVFWLPGRLPSNYVEHLMFLAIGCDLAITLMLCSSARRGGPCPAAPTSSTPLVTAAARSRSGSPPTPPPIARSRSSAAAGRS